ncbi:hypothetical protein [Arthrobacter sp. NEB 688]|uniref:hypothetical protein n=1 Tax=Arthrobacter sp. NEB 688 TaxID=904039 RepID=UPI0015676EE3|nr:hypothetical protein [Arthrobacter sp. NEB 688]QKE85473.1 hypothetical protein HL663_17085 [Arthrobacter sp. NEB 688]
MSVVPGDPGSLSACAAAAADVARRLEASGTALAPAMEALGDGWPGRASVTARRRGAELAAGAVAAAEELERLGRELQDRATDLADLVARGRMVEERAAAAGLAVRDGRVVPAWGVRGEADAGAVADGTVAAERIGAELTLVLHQHRRRRDLLLADLRASTDRLAALSHTLRRG